MTNRFARSAVFDNPPMFLKLFDKTKRRQLKHMARTRKKFVARSSSPTRSDNTPASSTNTATPLTKPTAPGTSQSETQQPSTSGNVAFSPVKQSKPAFRVTFEKDPYNHTNWEYQSITKMPEFQSYSFEQLRWENYVDAKKFEKEKDEEPRESRETNPTQPRTKYHPTATTFNLFSGESQPSTTTLALSASPNVHVNSLSRDFGSLLPFNNSSFARSTSDVTIKSNDNKSFHAHKLVLACRSPRLQKLLYSSGKQTLDDRLEISHEGTLELTFTQHASSTVEDLLRWIYTGQLSNASTEPQLHNFKQMYEISDTLDIHLLMEHCLTEIKSRISMDNIATIWRWAHDQKIRFNQEHEEVEEEHEHGEEDDQLDAVEKLFDELFLSIEGVFFRSLPALVTNNDNTSSFYTWDETFVMDTFIPTTESWLIMRSVLSDLVISRMFITC